MNIMVVDDERIAREGIKTLLQGFYPDAEIFVFGRSDEAIEAADTKKFFIACLDVMMEPFNGIETARELIKRQKKLNIIFTTGFDSFSMEAMNLHASGYILKPVTKKKLEAELSFLRYEDETEKKGGGRAESALFRQF